MTGYRSAQLKRQCFSRSSHAGTLATITARAPEVAPGHELTVIVPTRKRLRRSASSPPTIAGCLSFSLSQTMATAIAMISNFTLNNWLTYRDCRLTGWRFAGGLFSFMLICSFGGIANIGMATLLFTQKHAYWWVAGIAGAAVSSVWNYAVTSVLTWRTR